MTLTRFTRLAVFAGTLVFIGYVMQPSMENVSRLREAFDIAMPFEAEGAEARLQALASIPDHDRVIYPAQGEKRHTLVVLSDPTCPHCQAFHGEIPKLNAKGWEVQVLIAPRGGPESEYWPASRSIWCAQDRKAALEAKMANTGGDLVAPECSTQGLAAIVTTAESLGIMRRPYLVLEAGQGIKGALPADAFAEIETTILNKP